MTYPRNAAAQAQLVRDYRVKSATAGVAPKPVMQSLYVDLVAKPDTEPSPIHLGFRSGVTFLKSYLRDLQGCGINHVALNLRFNGADIEDTLNRLADDLLPDFPNQGTPQ